MWGEPTFLLALCCCSIYFNSLAPCGANQFDDQSGSFTLAISTHSPRVGRTSTVAPRLATTQISTHSPRVGRTKRRLFTWAIRILFQLTRPVWGEPLYIDHNTLCQYISTHSPRVGRTHRSDRRTRRYGNFNSLAPCGANLSGSNISAPSCGFQLTRPVWGEPYQQAKDLKASVNFNSLAPCGANLEELLDLFTRNMISTHSPRVGRTFGYKSP